MGKAKGAVVCHITDTQKSLLATAAVAVGYCDSTGDSFARLRKVLKRIDDDEICGKLTAHMSVHRASPRQTTVPALGVERQTNLACAVTYWGSQHFERILALVALLPPGRDGIGRAEKYFSRLEGGSRIMGAADRSAAAYI